MLQNTGKGRDKRMKSGLVAVITVVCLVGSAGATYLFVNEMNQSEIDSLTLEYESEMSSLNDTDEDRQKFDRLILKARETLDTAWLNRGYAEAYQDEADYSYDIALYDWGEIYYSYTQDYVSYAREAYGEGKLIFGQAEDYATNDKTLEFTQTYIEYIDSTRELLSYDYEICDNLRLACYYYNLSEMETGDGYLEDSNDALAEKNDYIDIYNDLLGEIELMLDTSWIE